jgi:geranylgeranyl transferase type-2 subunit alpha
MCTFDPELALKAMAPNLGADQRKGYIASEREFVEELLEDTTDCKWVYQALTELALLEAKLDGSMSYESETKILGWVAQLKALDPLRKGRWMDLEKSVSSS